MVRISEIFYSIQGEGVHAGVPTTFIRMQGCNLLPGMNCRYCDTSYAQDSNKGTEMSIVDILDKCVAVRNSTYRHWVCVTGGEPLAQLEALHELVKGLRNYGFRIEVETNGTLPKPSWWTLVDSWVADIKCPSSGVGGLSLEEWFITRGCDQVKFVVGDREDLRFSRNLITKYRGKNPTILVSPVLTEVLIDQAWMEEVVEFCKELRVSFSLQVHKVCFGNKRGT